MQSTSRTVVKSPPELWELIDHQERMQGLMSSLLGYATEVEVYERDPGNCLGWESREQGDQNWIEVEIGANGWGTEVKVTAECARQEPQQLEGWLDAVMDELSVPTKRPFDGMV